ncbi:MAG TPA: hypothetical protein VGJ59_09500 [Jatrophihabitantaceae bacterium]
MAAIELEAAYELPVPLMIDSDLFGREFPIALGGLDGTLLMPNLTWHGREPVMGAPSLRAASESAPRWLRPEAVRFFWGATHTQWSDTHLVTAGTLITVGLRFVDVPDDNVAYGESRYGRGAPTGPTVDALFESIGPWFDAFSIWVAVLTRQDMDVDAPLQALRGRGHGLSVWAIDGGVWSHLIHAESSVIHLQDADMLTLATVQRILGLVERGEVPPAGHLPLVSARAAMIRGQYRRAVIEAATAAELALNRLFEQKLARLPKVSRQALLDEQRTLGLLEPLVRNMTGDVRLPADMKANLVTPRNRAMHSNQQPTSQVAARALAIAAEGAVALSEGRARQYWIAPGRPCAQRDQASFSKASRTRSCTRRSAVIA